MSGKDAGLSTAAKWFRKGKEYIFDLMRHRLKSEPEIDEMKLFWTFSIVLFWQDVYSLSPCGPVRGFRRFRWEGRLLQTSHFYTPVGAIINNTDGYATSTITGSRSLWKTFFKLTVKHKKYIYIKLRQDEDRAKMNLLYTAESGSKWMLTLVSPASAWGSWRLFSEWSKKDSFLFHMWF